MIVILHIISYFTGLLDLLVLNRDFESSTFIMEFTVPNIFQLMINCLLLTPTKSYLLLYMLPVYSMVLTLILKY